MRRILLIALISLVVLVALGLGYFYFYPRKAQNILIPEIDQLKNASIKLRGDTAYADLTIRFKNKGIFKIHIDSLIYAVSFDTLRVLNKKQAIGLVLKAGDIDSMSLPVALPYKRVVKRIGELQGRDSTDITTDVRIVYNTLFGKASLPHKKTHRIGTPRPPEFELEKIDYVRREGKKFFFLVHIKMINHGKMALRLSKIRYALTLKELVKAEGVHPEEIEVKPQATMQEKLAVEAEFSHFWKAMMMILKDDDMVPYRVIVTGELAGGEGKEPTAIRLETKGLMELRK